MNSPNFAFWGFSEVRVAPVLCPMSLLDWNYLVLAQYAQNTPRWILASPVLTQLC
jgi:hypothetical protein